MTNPKRKRINILNPDVGLINLFISTHPIDPVTTLYNRNQSKYDIISTDPQTITNNSKMIMNDP